MQMKNGFVLIATIDFPYLTKNQTGVVGKPRYKLCLLLECDSCKRTFLRKKCVKAALAKSFHSCSILCARRSEHTKQASKLTSFRKLGMVS